MEKRKPHEGFVVWLPTTKWEYGGIDTVHYVPVLCDDEDEVLETIVAAGAEKFQDIVVTREVLWKLTVS